MLAFGLLVAGCGEAGGNENSIGAGLARQANAACMKVSLRVGAEMLKAYNSEPVKKAASGEEAINLETKMFLPIFIKDAKDLVKFFRVLTPAPEDAQQIDLIVSAYDDWIEEASDEPRKVVLRNDVFNEARRLAAQYGMTRCAQSPFEVNRGG